MMRNKISYWLMVILMLLLLASLSVSALTSIVILATGESSSFLTDSSDEAHQGHLGKWLLVGTSIVIFTFFSLGYILPVGKHNWRAAGMGQAFIIALFTEMFGFPLTIYAVSGAFGGTLALDKGDHLLARGISFLTGLDTGVAITSTMALSLILLTFALVLIFLGWKEIYKAKGQLVTRGIYRHLRHPQYAGFFLFIFAWLVQWPTIITVILAPALIITYHKLALRDEKELKGKFGDEYIPYQRTVPRYIPAFLSHRSASISNES